MKRLTITLCIALIGVLGGLESQAATSVDHKSKTKHQHEQVRNQRVKPGQVWVQAHWKWDKRICQNVWISGRWVKISKKRRCYPQRHRH